MKIKTKITLGFVLIIFSILFSCKHEIPDNKKVLKTYYVQDDTYGVWTFYDDGSGTYSTQKKSVSPVNTAYFTWTTPNDNTLNSYALINNNKYVWQFSNYDNIFLWSDFETQLTKQNHYNEIIETCGYKKCLLLETPYIPVTDIQGTIDINVQQKWKINYDSDYWDYYITLESNQEFTYQEFYKGNLDETVNGTYETHGNTITFSYKKDSYSNPVKETFYVNGTDSEMKLTFFQCQYYEDDQWVGAKKSLMASELLHVYDSKVTEYTLERSDSSSNSDVSGSIDFDYTDSWELENDSVNRYLQINDNGTFQLENLVSSYNSKEGTYSVNGNQIIFEYENTSAGITVKVTDTFEVTGSSSEMTLTLVKSVTNTSGQEAESTSMSTMLNQCFQKALATEITLVKRY